jgi:hypothetical protein
MTPPSFPPSYQLYSMTTPQQFARNMIFQKFYLDYASYTQIFIHNEHFSLIILIEY